VLREKMRQETLTLGTSQRISMLILFKVKSLCTHSHNFFGLHLQKGIGHLHDLLLGLVLLLVAVQLSLDVLPVVLSTRSYRTK
jgi:hypothetical protein